LVTPAATKAAVIVAIVPAPALTTPAIPLPTDTGGLGIIGVGACGVAVGIDGLDGGAVGALGAGAVGALDGGAEGVGTDGAGALVVGTVGPVGPVGPLGVVGSLPNSFSVGFLANLPFSSRKGFSFSVCFISLILSLLDFVAFILVPIIALIISLLRRSSSAS
jgi:hypothetical protein